MAILKRDKKAEAASTPKTKNLDKMIEEKPAHYVNEIREYLRKLVKGGK